MKKNSALFNIVCLITSLISVLSLASLAVAAQTPVSIASGPSGGGYYIVGAALASVVQKHVPELSVNSEATGATSENLRLVVGKESTIGMGMCNDVVSAYQGIRDFENKAATDLRILMAGQTNFFHVIVKADSDIKTLSDLRGKRVSTGPAGAPFFVPDLLEKVAGLKKGTDYNGQYLGHDQAADALANGDIDCIIATVAYPSGAYSSLAMTQDVRFLSFTDDELAKVEANFPYWRTKDIFIPKDTYKNSEDIRTVSVPVWLFADVSTDEDVIYKFVKAICENTEELGKIHPDAGKYSIETALNGVSIVPFHAGAIKYFKEKGVM
jgi:TRAP transporter TAXI family solute receptor